LQEKATTPSTLLPLPQPPSTAHSDAAPDGKKARCDPQQPQAAGQAQEQPQQQAVEVQAH